MNDCKAVKIELIVISTLGHGLLSTYARGYSPQCKDFQPVFMQEWNFAPLIVCYRASLSVLPSNSEYLFSNSSIRLSSLSKTSKGVGFIMVANP